VEPSNKPVAGWNRRSALPKLTGRKALPAPASALRLLTAAFILALAAVGCMDSRANSEAENMLTKARAALETVESFRMDTRFTAPLPGSGQVTSLTVVWAAPETILTLAQGGGDPRFQQVYQEGETCLARYSEDADWEWLHEGCAAPGQIRPTFRAWLEIEDPVVVSEGNGVMAVRGKAVDGDSDDEDEPPVVAFWELEIDTETSLVRRAAGYAQNGTTMLINTDVNSYNEPFDAVFSELNLPEGL
jgi:hypothetical protein